MDIFFLSASKHAIDIYPNRWVGKKMISAIDKKLFGVLQSLWKYLQKPKCSGKTLALHITAIQSAAQRKVSRVFHKCVKKTREERLNQNILLCVFATLPDVERLCRK